MVDERCKISRKALEVIQIPSILSENLRMLLKEDFQVC